MAWLNIASAGGGSWSAPLQMATDVRSTGRRGWVISAWLVMITIALAIASYSISVRVAAEKRQVARLTAANHGLESDIKALNAELRVRMRMPQLQRWNDETFGLTPISAHQYLESPDSLGAYGNELPAAAPPRVTYAVRDISPASRQPAPRVMMASTPPEVTPRSGVSETGTQARAGAPRPALITASANKATSPSATRLVAVSNRPAAEASRSRPAAEAAGNRPAATAVGQPRVVLAAATPRQPAAAIDRPAEAPADLLRQVAMLGDDAATAEH